MIQIKGFAVSQNRFVAAAHVVHATTVIGPDRTRSISVASAGPLMSAQDGQP
jgi:hypothetical protein